MSIAGLYWAFYDFKFDEFLNAVKNSNIFLIMIACMTIIFSVWLRAVRWKLLISASNLTVKDLYDIEMIGFFGNNILPLRAGEIYRSILLSKKTNLSKSYCFGTIVIERTLDLIGILIAFSVLTIFYPIPKDFKNLVIILFLVLATIILVFFTSDKLFDLKQIKKINFLDQFFRSYINLNAKTIFLSILWTILIWFIYFLDTHLIQYALNINMSWEQTLFVLVMTSLAMAIPSAPGTIGTFHATVKFVMVSILGFEANLANTYGIILHAYGFITLTIIGAYYFLFSIKKQNLI